MTYNIIRKRLNKYAKGGEILKLQEGGEYLLPGQKKAQEDALRKMNALAMERGLSMEQSQQLYNAYRGDINTINTMFDDGLSVEDMLSTGPATDSVGNAVTVNLQEGTDFGSPEADKLNAGLQEKTSIKKPFDQQKALDATNAAFGAIGFNGVQTEQKYDKDGNKVGLSEGGQIAVGITSQAISKTLQSVDEATMGDKNFSASSQAIDAGVHGVSGALMKSGNPYAIAAGAALEGLNFVTKAAGKNVQGYDVDINNSGYGNMGHMESEAGRIWDSWSGATARKLRKRNEQARMALAAADISQDTAYEQEARSNSVTNVLQQNQIALAGGIDTSLLGN